MSRKPLIAANWKMHKTLAESRRTGRELRQLVDDVADVEVVVCPPFTSLAALGEELEGSRIGLGGQDAHWEENGAYTAQISVGMLQDCGCRYVILGHSEMREYQAETDRRVNRKLKRVLESELAPIVCVGEKLAEREAGRARDVVLGQLEKAVEGLAEPRLGRLIIAYEPVWAIGTGRTATPDTAQEMHSLIRGWLGKRFSSELPGKTRILYGGSVKPSNVAELMAQPDIDGALVGGASLEASTFAKLVRFREA